MEIKYFNENTKIEVVFYKIHFVLPKRQILDLI